MYKALISFCGVISMVKGEVGEIPDKALADDLIKAKYVEKVEGKPEAETKPVEKKPRAKKK
jgi:hypothetical protein